MSDLLSEMKELLGGIPDTSFKAVVLARANRSSLNEVSLGRVYQHLQSANEKSFAILTSWRQGVSVQANNKSFEALKGKIRGSGLGFFKLVGHWKEEGQEEATAEPSLFVPGISKQQAVGLGLSYNQDAVIYGGPETQGLVTLIFKGGGEQSIGKFHPGRIAQAYSSLRGKTFTFEGFEYPAQTFVEGLIERETTR